MTAKRFATSLESFGLPLLLLAPAADSLRFSTSRVPSTSAQRANMRQLPGERGKENEGDLMARAPAEPKRSKQPPKTYARPNLIALIDSRRQMSPCQALIGRGHEARTLRPRREEVKGGKYQSEFFYSQFAKTGSRLPLLRPQPWLRKSLLRLGKPPLTAARNAMLRLSSRY